METKTTSSVYPLAMTAVMSAVLCVLCPLAIPIPTTPIRITLSFFLIFLSLYLLGWKRGTLSCLIYILLGLVGMPVFSGHAAGVAALAGPTGGYIIGYLPLAVISGLVIDKSKNRALQAAGMIVGAAVCYAFGTAWFCLQSGKALAYALGACVFPFIPADLAKIAAVLSIGPILRRRLEKVGINPAGQL